MCIPTDLQGIKDPIHFLKIFAHKVRIGVLSANHNPIHKRSVGQYIRSVGHIFAAMGSPDARLDTMGAIDFRLRGQFSTYTEEDPPPVILLPLPVSILHCMDSIAQGSSPRGR